jgi:hypothetical protein
LIDWNKISTVTFSVDAWIGRAAIRPGVTVEEFKSRLGAVVSKDVPG